MKRKLFLTAVIGALLCSMAACGPTPSHSGEGGDGTDKSVEITSISLANENNKAYIKVRGVQTNYTADNFKWAWGLMSQDGNFDEGKEIPEASDYKKVAFEEDNSFSVNYCLTDLKNIHSGTLYRIYGGTPETYGDIPFQSNNFGASDATRKYYLRSDQENSLVFDNIQPISFTKASVVEVAESELPAGVTNAGAYVKFGGANSKNLTKDMIDSWHQDEKIAGNFQRVVGGSYEIHAHVDEERFWKIEGNDVFFYCYVGFIEEGEGWMTHFDLVSGNSTANFQLDSTIKGETPYVVNGVTYRVYADKNASGEENYWGCLGVLREAAQE